MAQQLAAIYRDKDCDAIVAVGQGPLLDITKWLNLMVSTGQETPAAFDGGTTIPRSLKPLAVVPSAAADGYELSGYLRMGDVTLRSVHLMPPLLFIDSRATGMPGEVAMIETALGALSNAIEVFYGEAANPMSAVYARTAAKLAAEALRQLASGVDGGDSVAPTVAHAAALSGCALGAGPRTMTQRLGDAVAQTGRISVSQATAVILSYALEYRTIEHGLKIDTLLGLLGGDDRYARTPDGQRSPSALYFLRNLLNRLFDTTSGQVCRTLMDAGLRRQDSIGAAMPLSSKENEPIAAACEVVLTHAWEGRPLR
jgi:alcohol dehydrogenase